MVQKLLSYLQFGNLFCGIEHTTINDNAIINVALLKKSKGQIVTETTFEANTVEDVANKLPKKQHVVLLLNTNSVLSKKIVGDINDNLKLVYNAFPNINLDDFYYEVLHQGKNHFVSICRKKYVNKLIETYETHQVKIIKFALGHSTLSTILEFIPEKTITTSNTEITLENHLISNTKKKSDNLQKKYSINGLEVTNTTLMPLSGALQTVLKTNNSQTNFEAEKQSFFKAFKQSQFFDQFFKHALIFILGLLLVNFLFFNHYYNKVSKLQQASQVNKSNKATILSLNENVNKTKKIVDDVLKSSASKSSFYTNEIIQSLPSTLLLKEFNFKPLLRRIKVDQTIVYDKDIIMISGESSSSSKFSKWIAQLEAKKWVKSIEIIDYKDLSKSKSEFNIKLNMNND